MWRDGWRLRTRGAVAASALLGACVAAPLTKPVDVTPPAESAQPPPPPTAASATPRVEPPKTAAQVDPDPPGEPRRGVGERLVKKSPVKSFTRRIDRARIEARGASRMKAGVSAPTPRAVTVDNEEWQGVQRRELLAYLRGVGVAEDAEFTLDDARIIARLQAGSGAVVDGELKEGQTMAVLFAMGFRFSSPRKATPWEVRLEFYPGEVEDPDAWVRAIDDVAKIGGDFRDLNVPDGEGTIYVYVGRSIVGSYRARGGPPSVMDDGGHHTAGPTKAGDYRLAAGRPHVTSNWYYSQIPWGAEIRKYDSGYQYRWPGGSEWAWATSNPAGKLKLPLATDDFDDLPKVTRDGVTFLVWNKNDFGPISWNLVPSDMYVHTTPEEETGTEPDGAAPHAGDAALPLSHGCIHVQPRERDEMEKVGYLDANVPFIVRQWNEHLLPDQVRHEMLGR